MATITCPVCSSVNQASASYCRTCGRALQVASSGVGFNTATGRLLPNSLLKQRYRILTTLGKGGMGAVYIAEDTQLGNRTVAVKEMSQSGLSPQEIAEATDNFKREALILAALQHHHLPNIYDHFSDSGRWYLVMTYIKGETLEDYLERSPGKKLPVKEALEVGIQLCTVLDYLHSQQPPIIFRDLKPSNIMRAPDGHIYLIDFGIARHFKPGQARDTAYFGSAGYASPEQYGRAQTTPRSDIYSLGAVLHQLISGRHPATAPFRFPPLQSPGQPVPADLGILIMQMVEMDETKRPPTMAAVKHKLQEIAASLSTTASGNVSGYAPTVLAKPPVTPVQPVQPAQPAQPVKPTVLAQSATPAQLQQQAFGHAVQQKARPTTPSVWRLDKRRLIAMLVGVVLCGLLELWLDHGIYSYLPIWSTFLIGNNRIFIDGFLALSCAEFVVVFYFAAVYGPWVGLIVGGVATLLPDLINRLVPILWYGDVGLAVGGFIVGLTLLSAYRRSGHKRNIRLVTGISLTGIVLTTTFSVAGTYRPFDGNAVIIILVYSVLYSAISLIVLAIMLAIYNAVAVQRSTP
jgi:serine/threonine protein kinase/uncharacterized membrane protein